MKTKTILCLVLFLISVKGFSQWEWLQPRPDGNGFFHLQFPDSLTGYAIGGGTFLRKSTDGGNTWTNIYTFQSSNNNYSCTRFTDPLKGFLSLGGTMEKTTDGGITWNPCSLPGSSMIEDIRFADNLHGFVLADSGFYATTDGGATWQARTAVSEFGSALFVLDPLNVYIHSFDFIKHSTDGGLTWVTMNNPPSSSNIYTIWFFNSLDGLVTGEQGEIFRTTNGGNSWQSVTSPTTQSLYKIYFVNPDTGYICGYTRILKSTDHGLTWKVTDSSYREYRNIVFTNSSKGFVTGDYGFLEKSLDGGESWNLANTVTTNNLSSVTFPDARHGYACNPYEILRTRDYGYTWEILNTPLHRMFFDVFFTDTLHGWAASDSGFILRTTDGGNTWASESMGYSGWESINTVMFLNADTGFFGSYTKIGRTTDGGQTWVLPQSPIGGVTTISFVTPTIGYSANPSGGMQKTTDGGLTWNYYLPTDECQEICFLDSLNGYYTNHDPGLMKTTDGGITWQPLSIPIWDPRSLQFFNKDTGYICSSYGVVKTTDGGATFVRVDPHTTTYLRDIYFLDADTGYVVGDGGLIMKTTIGGIHVGIPEIASQNNLSVFPNPATEHLTIKIENQNLPAMVTILDLTGRSMRSMEIPPATAGFLIDISGLSKGMYMVRVAQGNNNSVRKIIKD